MRFHVHGSAFDRDTEEFLADLTVTVKADDDGDAQTKAWELFDDDVVRFDVSEIEEAE